MIDWSIPTMTCGHCAGVVTKTVRAADPSAQLEIDLSSRRVRIQSEADPAALAAALAAEGYRPDDRVGLSD